MKSNVKLITGSILFALANIALLPGVTIYELSGVIYFFSLSIGWFLLMKYVFKWKPDSPTINQHITDD